MSFNIHAKFDAKQGILRHCAGHGLKLIHRSKTSTVGQIQTEQGGQLLTALSNLLVRTDDIAPAQESLGVSAGTQPFDVQTAARMMFQVDAEGFKRKHVSA